MRFNSFYLRSSEQQFDFSSEKNASKKMFFFYFFAISVAEQYSHMEI